MEQFDGLGVHLGNLARLSPAQSRSISAENRTGGTGAGGGDSEGVASFAARDLGRGWKLSPCLTLEPSSVTTLADIAGPGAVTHIWITTDSTKWRSLVLRHLLGRRGDTVDRSSAGGLLLQWLR